MNNGDTAEIGLLAIMIAAASIFRKRTLFPGWFAIAGLVFTPLLAVSGLAFPLSSEALYASLAVTLIGLLAWGLIATIVSLDAAARSRDAHRDALVRLSRRFRSSAARHR